MLSSLYTASLFLKQGTLINMLDLKEASPTESALFVISKTFLDDFFFFCIFYSLLFCVPLSVCFEIIMHRSYNTVGPMFLRVFVLTHSMEWS